MSTTDDMPTTTSRHAGPKERSNARFVNIDDAATFLGISRGLAYKEARRFLETGDGLRCVKVGERLRVPRTWLDRLAEPLSDTGA
jgi:hypothetical protein